MNKTDYEKLSSAMQLNHKLYIEQHDRADRLQAENERLRNQLNRRLSTENIETRDVKGKENENNHSKPTT